jgi:hypothetical protein
MPGLPMGRARYAECEVFPNLIEGRTDVPARPTGAGAAQIWIASLVVAAAASASASESVGWAWIV